MKQILFIDRKSSKIEKEEVYGESALNFLYGEDLISKIFGVPLLNFIVRYPFFSKCYGWWQKSQFSKKKIKPFIEKFKIDSSEFLQPIEAFTSFNDFFIRKLKPSVRPFDLGESVAIIPADGRYRFYQNLDQVKGFIVKGKKFSLEKLLCSKELAKKYKTGSMVMARLCPTDYHRFHFPFACKASPSKVINGFLYSVNPIALTKNIEIFTENKRSISILRSEIFGEVIFIEVGATNVGSINQTYQEEVFLQKGEEKGYFAFGGSSLILLFEEGKITFDKDLIKALESDLETKCLMGQSMGQCK